MGFAVEACYKEQPGAVAEINLEFDEHFTPVNQDVFDDVIQFTGCRAESAHGQVVGKREVEDAFDIGHRHIDDAVAIKVVIPHQFPPRRRQEPGELDARRPHREDIKVHRLVLANHLHKQEARTADWHQRVCVGIFAVVFGNVGCRAGKEVDTVVEDVDAKLNELKASGTNNGVTSKVCEADETFGVHVTFDCEHRGKRGRQHQPVSHPHQHVRQLNVIRAEIGQFVRGDDATAWPSCGCEVEVKLNHGARFETAPGQFPGWAFEKRQIDVLTQQQQALQIVASVQRREGHSFKEEHHVLRSTALLCNDAVNQAHHLW